MHFDLGIQYSPQAIWLRSSDGFSSNASGPDITQAIRHQLTIGSSFDLSGTVWLKKWWGVTSGLGYSEQGETFRLWPGRLPESDCVYPPEPWPTDFYAFQTTKVDYEVKLSYITIPLESKFRIALSPNFSFVAGAGVQYGRLAKAKHNLSDFIICNYHVPDAKDIAVKNQWAAAINLGFGRAVTSKLNASFSIQGMRAFSDAFASAKDEQGQEQMQNFISRFRHVHSVTFGPAIGLSYSFDK